jgi:hypothetical protein
LKFPRQEVKFCLLLSGKRIRATHPKALLKAATKIRDAGYQEISKNIKEYQRDSISAILEAIKIIN